MLTNIVEVDYKLWLSKYEVRPSGSVRAWHDDVVGSLASRYIRGPLLLILKQSLLFISSAGSPRCWAATSTKLSTSSTPTARGRYIRISAANPVSNLLFIVKFICSGQIDIGEFKSALRHIMPTDMLSDAQVKNTYSSVRIPAVNS